MALVLPFELAFSLSCEAPPLAPAAPLSFETAMFRNILFMCVGGSMHTLAPHRSQTSADKRASRAIKLHFILERGTGTLTESQQRWDCLNISHWICSHVHCLRLCSLLCCLHVGGGPQLLFLDAFVSFKSSQINFGTFFLCNISKQFLFLFLDQLKSVPFLHKE